MTFSTLKLDFVARFGISPAATVLLLNARGAVTNRPSWTPRRAEAVIAIDQIATPINTQSKDDQR